MSRRRVARAIAYLETRAHADGFEQSAKGICRPPIKQKLIRRCRAIQMAASLTSLGAACVAGSLSKRMFPGSKSIFD